MTGGLTAAEHRVLVLVANGLTDKEAADRLGVSEQTVKNQLGSVYRRLGVANRWGAMIAMGWLVPPEHDTETKTYRRIFKNQILLTGRECEVETQRILELERARTDCDCPYQHPPHKMPRG